MVLLVLPLCACAVRPSKKTMESIAAKMVPESAKCVSSKDVGNDICFSFKSDKRDLVFEVYSIKNDRDFIGQFDVRLVEEFFRSVCCQVKMNLHILNEYGDENHHIVESVFKAFARALRMAVEHDARDNGIPSSKGVIQGA